MHVHKWENSEILHQIWTLNQANQNDWPKENWKNWPIKVIQIAWGCDSVSLSLSLSLSLGAYPRESIHSLHIPFPPNKYFTCFTTFHLHGNFLLQSRRSRALSLTTGRVARIWCSHHQDPTSSLAGEPKPCLKLHRTKPSEIITMAMFKTKKLQEKLGK